jgi:class 3 adenylate cyclase
VPAFAAAASRHMSIESGASAAILALERRRSSAAAPGGDATVAPPSPLALAQAHVQAHSQAQAQAQAPPKRLSIEFGPMQTIEELRGAAAAQAAAAACAARGDGSGGDEEADEADEDAKNAAAAPARSRSASGAAAVTAAAAAAAAAATAAAAAAAAAAVMGPAPPALPPVGERRPLSHAGATAAFALDMLAEVRRVREETGIDVRVRVGVHCGRVVGGVIGKTRPRYLIWGEETLVANCMESTGIVGGVQVSEAAARVLQQEGFELAPHRVVDVSSRGAGAGAGGAAASGGVLGGAALRAAEAEELAEEELAEASGGGGLAPARWRRSVNTYRLVAFTDATGVRFAVDDIA